MKELIISNIVALVTFFAFPAIRYFFLKINAKKEGVPQLWYLPAFGFRLVIRNLPRKRVLSDIKYQAVLRQIIPPSPGASVASYVQYIIRKNEDFFVMPGTDQILMSFKLKLNKNNELLLITADVLGKQNTVYTLSYQDSIICDYMATVENWFNFNIRLAKRVEIKASLLKEIYESILTDNYERNFEVSNVVNL